jgi:hypothetical protein
MDSLITDGLTDEERQAQEDAAWNQHERWLAEEAAS